MTSVLSGVFTSVEALTGLGVSIEICGAILIYLPLFAILSMFQSY